MAGNRKNRGEPQKSCAGNTLLKRKLIQFPDNRRANNRIDELSDNSQKNLYLQMRKIGV
jgi:hypothetical protein